MLSDEMRQTCGSSTTEPAKFKLVAVEKAKEHDSPRAWDDEADGGETIITMFSLEALKTPKPAKFEICRKRRPEDDCEGISHSGVQRLGPMKVTEEEEKELGSA